MNNSRKRTNIFGIIVMGLLLATAIPATALGQGRGRGHGKDNGRDNGRDNGSIGWPTRTTRSSNNNIWNNDKKCAKFRNCHDARNGRWDGRGPSGNRVGNVVWRNRLRNRNVDNNRLWRVRRARSQNRN